LGNIWEYHMVNVVSCLWPPIWISSNNKVVRYVPWQYLNSHVKKQNTIVWNWKYKLNSQNWNSLYLLCITFNYYNNVPIFLNNNIFRKQMKEKYLYVGREKTYLEHLQHTLGHARAPAYLLKSWWIDPTIWMLTWQS